MRCWVRLVLFLRWANVAGFQTRSHVGMSVCLCAARLDVAPPLSLLRRALEDAVLEVTQVEIPETLIIEQAREKFAIMMTEFKDQGQPDEQIQKMITKEVRTGIAVFFFLATVSLPCSFLFLFLLTLFMLLLLFAHVVATALFLALVASFVFLITA